MVWLPVTCWGIPMIETGIGALALGFVVGYIVCQRLNRKPSIVIDRDLLNQIDAVCVGRWLDQRGMVWQPKGAIFKPGKECRK